MNNETEIFEGSGNMSGLAYIMDYYRYTVETKGDPRTANWLLMSSPVPLFTILASYLYFCVSAGPRYMKDRKPYQLKQLILLYNAVQVGMSIFLVHEAVYSGWFTSYSYTCQPVDYSDNPEAKRMAGAVWWYFMCKIIELLDTVFFVLRKKSNQVSFLHLYHHTMMPICGWVGTRFIPGGHGTLLGMINSFIHIIMYSYYMVAGLGPQYQKYLWWKRYLTTLQMVQFCIVFFHSFIVLLQPSCNYPKPLAALLSLQSIVFLYLFGAFYIRTYMKTTAANGTTKSNVQAKGSVLAQNGSVKNKTEKVL